MIVVKDEGFMHLFGGERMIDVSDEHTGFPSGPNGVNLLEARILCCGYLTTSLL